MSAGSKLLDWCRVPPPVPKNDHKKLFASGILCAILSVSIFASIPIYSTLLTGSVSGITSSGSILSIANLGHGPLYLQNATYQQIAEANNDTMQSYEVMALNTGDGSNGLSVSSVDYSAGDETSAIINSTIVNAADKDLTATSLEIYRGSSIFAQINGPFLIKAHSVGSVIIQLNNLESLSKEEAQLITQYRHGGEADARILSGRVTYQLTLKTSENVTASYPMFAFPTAYVWPDCA